eukprot:TRINITY_DN14693_c0_g1_i1.p1 TRINITY_DN14693_c0_g1~~TRINITY_DN14693_c0_g1_i1.p1  ORF type:complete len:447 (+),score=89.73 TRINITY_DN14693_c0_g1_i1:182-1522(+)
MSDAEKEMSEVQQHRDTDSGAQYQSLPGTSSGPVSPVSREAAATRTDEEKRLLKAKLIEFYRQYNPDFLRPGDSGAPDDFPDVDRIVNSTTPERNIWIMLHQKYCEESDEDQPDHPQLVEEGQRQQVFRKRTAKPKGGDANSRRFSDYTMALIWPVSVTMLIVVWVVNNFTPIYKNANQRPLYLAYSESNPGDSAGKKFSGALLNALIVVGFFVVITFLMVLLYKLRCMKVIAGWLVISSAAILYFMAWIWFDLFCVKYQIPYDTLTVTILMWNFGTVGVTCIYWRGHPKMTQAYLVATSAIMAWFLTRFPEWTTWVLLAAIACYDLYAVLSTAGPLKALVEESQKRGEPIPGLVYESKSYKLGLGDFVFYSVLVGRASMYMYITWEVCFVAILTGLCGTLSCLGAFQKALPALPISIFTGIAVYFLARYLLVPYVTEMATNGGCL